MLLTTSIVEIGVEILGGILARDAALGQGDAESVAVEPGHSGGLAKRKPLA